MAGGKKRGTNKTPRRTSNRKRLRSLKGQQYDEQFHDLANETELGENVGNLDISIPAIGTELDTTRDIEERIVCTENGLDTDTEETDLPTTDDDVNRYLSNLYDIHHLQPCHVQHALVELFCFNKVDSVVHGADANDSGNRGINVLNIDGGESAAMRNKPCSCSEISSKLSLKTRECDILSKELFDLHQQLKILKDRAQQLTDGQCQAKAYSLSTNLVATTESFSNWVHLLRLSDEAWLFYRRKINFLSYPKRRVILRLM